LTVELKAQESITRG